jgi:hypothetical protein
MRSSSRDAIKSAPEQARLPSRATYALRRHEGFYAFGHCKSSRRSQASRVAGYAWSAASPPFTRAATCASTRPSKPPRHPSNSIGSHASWASFYTLRTHSGRSQRGSSNDWTCTTARAATQLRDPGRSPAHEPTGGASYEEQFGGRAESEGGSDRSDRAIRDQGPRMCSRRGNPLRPEA